MSRIAGAHRDGISKRETACTKLSYLDERYLRDLASKLDLNKSQVLRAALRVLLLQLGYEVPVDNDVSKVLEYLESTRAQSSQKA